MNNRLPECDFGDPGSVVTAFITAMNAWEIAAWKAQRASRESGNQSAYQSPVLAEMNRIFRAYCTPKERKRGRKGSFQRPPEYDPDNEAIMDVAVDDGQRRAFVTTKRQAVLGGGAYRYTLHNRHGKWLIENLKRESDGKWINHIL